MDRIDKFLWLVCHAALTTLVVIVCVKLCAGCKSVESEAARASISKVLQIAYENGGKVAVSNRIERLVIDGRITPEQGARLHAAAQFIYDGVIEDLAPKGGDACDGSDCNEDANCGNCDDCKVSNP